MTNYQQRQVELEKRTVQFSREIIAFSKKYQKNPLLASILVQLIKSATSVGANYHEANNASSKADFKNKIFISKKEASETRYWLDVLTGQTNEVIRSRLRQEAQELLMILQAIVNTLNNSKAGK